jgi:hypothetical protein
MPVLCRNDDGYKHEFSEALVIALAGLLGVLSQVYQSFIMPACKVCANWSNDIEKLSFT